MHALSHYGALLLPAAGGFPVAVPGGGGLSPQLSWLGVQSQRAGKGASEGASQGVIAGCTTGCSIGRVTERVEMGSEGWHLLPVRTGHPLKTMAV